MIVKSDLQLATDEYIEKCIEDMDASTMEVLITELMNERFESMTSEDILNEIKQSVYSEIATEYEENK